MESEKYKDLYGLRILVDIPLYLVPIRMLTLWLHFRSRFLLSFLWIGNRMIPFGSQQFQSLGLTTVRLSQLISPPGWPFCSRLVTAGDGHPIHGRPPCMSMIQLRNVRLLSARCNSIVASFPTFTTREIS